ncbi:MAG: hypothetical protein KKE73_04225 [Proteobacteria bacterium]|nr:hypothetical protein [Pseudomonadota bacterium]
MQRHKYQCVDRVVEVAVLLGDLADEVVFVGGAAAGLLINDPAIPDVRPTLDIDVLVEVSTRGDYYRLQERLRDKGFNEAVGETVICRFKHGPIILDVMPTDPAILGFTNIWYEDAARNSKALAIGGVRLRVVTPAYFLATKLEAFRGRGKGDYALSHDMEDIIAVIDGCLDIVEEVEGAHEGVRGYLANQFAMLLADNDFQDALSGHLPGDAASQQRRPILIERMAKIARRPS